MSKDKKQKMKEVLKMGNFNESIENHFFNDIQNSLNVQVSLYNDNRITLFELQSRFSLYRTALINCIYITSAGYMQSRDIASNAIREYLQYLNTCDNVQKIKKFEINRKEV